MPNQLINVAPSRRKIGISILMIGLVSFSFLLALTLMLVTSYQSQKQSLSETTLKLNYSKAQQMSQTMSELFESMRNGLKYAADHLRTQEITGENQIRDMLNLVRLSGNYFNSLVLVDETGYVRQVSPQSIGTAGQKLTTAAGLQALAQQAPYISEPYLTATTNRLIVFLSHPLFDAQENYRGFIGGTLYLQEPNVINAIFGDSRIDEQGSYYYVIDSDGHLIFHPDIDRIGEDVGSTPIVSKLIQGIGGQELAANSRGIEMLAGFSPVDANGWGVAVVSPASVVYEQLKRHIRLLLTYTLPPLAVLLLVAIWLAQMLGRPFVQLAELVRKVGRDETLQTPVRNYWNREADLISRALASALTDIRIHNETLTHDAATDPLTGLMNRRSFDIFIEKWDRENTPFSIIVLDIDHFKRVNDTYGHQAGDEVLRYLASVVTRSVRPGDICCRYGGEEFVVLLALASVQEAYAVAERIRASVESAPTPIGVPITISLGIAGRPAHTHNTEELFRLADQAMYTAKNEGRNRTVIAALN